MSAAATRLREALIASTVRDANHRAAFANEGVPAPARVLIDKVARHAYQVTDEDVAAAKAAGVSEDELFELVVCAALGASARQLDAALGALDDALAEVP